MPYTVMDNSFSFLFIFVVILIVVVFIGILAVILVNFSRSVAQFNRNNRSPVLTVPAVLVAKRTVLRKAAMNVSDSFPDAAHTIYFAAFEYESGDRQEFTLRDEDYGLLAEGDRGMLTFQGTRYLRFEREVKIKP